MSDRPPSLSLSLCAEQSLQPTELQPRARGSVATQGAREHITQLAQLPPDTPDYAAHLTLCLTGILRRLDALEAAVGQ